MPLLHQRLQDFLCQTEVAPDILIYVASPLIEIYGLDATQALEAPDSLSPDELSVWLSFLHTAQLILAYVQLPEATQHQAYTRLESLFIDASASPEEIEETRLLIQELIQRAEHLVQERSVRTPDFEYLLAAYGCQEEALPDSCEGYGPEQLELTDALALFTQPILERYNWLEDPCSFEEAMNLASAYWVLAQTRPAHRERKIKQIQEEFASSPEEARFLATEAQHMIERFFTLFPEQAQRFN